MTANRPGGYWKPTDQGLKFDDPALEMAVNISILQDQLTDGLGWWSIGFCVDHYLPTGGDMEEMGGYHVSKSPKCSTQII